MGNFRNFITSCQGGMLFQERTGPADNNAVASFDGRYKALLSVRRLPVDAVPANGTVAPLSDLCPARETGRINLDRP